MYNLVIRQKHSLILIAIFKNQSINRNEFVERRGKAGVTKYAVPAWWEYLGVEKDRIESGIEKAQCHVVFKMYTVLLIL